MGRKPAWQTALTALGRKLPTKNDVDHTFSELTDERNDRGAALVAASQTEAMLQALIESWLVPPMSGDDKAALFDLNGPLGTFSSKISIAYAFGIIDRVMWKDLDRLRLIRNAFAHAKVPVKFRDPAIAIACSGFSLDGSVYTEFKHDPKNPRFAFITTATQLTAAFRLGKHFRRKGKEPPHLPITYRITETK